MTVKVINVDQDSWFANTLGGAGNGKGDRMGVGMGVGDWPWQNRFGIRLPRPAELDTIPSASSITGFRVKFLCSNAIFGIGAAVKFYLERSTASPAPTENSEERRDFVSTSGPASSEWDGGTTDTANRGEYIGAPSNNDWITVTMPVALAQWWYSHREVTALWLIAKASDGAGGYAESTTARRVVVCTAQSTTGKPYAELEWEPNTAPDQPVDLSPEADSVVGSDNGTQLAVAARYSDPDGDVSSAYQVQAYPDTATDDIPGAVLTGQDRTIGALTASGSWRSTLLTGLPARTWIKFRYRFWDGKAWSPWSLLRRVKTAYLPSVVNPSQSAGTTSPVFGDAITSGDPAGEYATAYEDVVYQDTPAGVLTKWASGKIAIGGNPTRVERTYTGDALTTGQVYRRKRRLWNKDGVPTTPDEQWPTTAVSISFTPSAAAGVQIKYGGTYLDASLKIDSLTPTLNVSDPNGNNIDQARLRAYVNGAVVYETALTSFAAAASHDFVIPAGYLNWDTEPTFDAAIRISGASSLGAFGDQQQGHMNSRPGAPTPVTVAPAASELVVQRSDGVWVSTSARPLVRFPFVDRDRDLGYTAETATLRDVEIRNSSYALIARCVRAFTSYPISDVEYIAGQIVAFDQPAALTPTDVGWVAGTAAALTFDTGVKVAGDASMKIALTNLPTATTSSQTLAGYLRYQSALWTDLSSTTTVAIACRKSASPTGLAIKLRFTFSGSAVNFAEFDITPTASGAFETKTLTLATPGSTGGSVNWAQVSGIEVTVRHTAGSNQSFNVYIDELVVNYATIETTTQHRARFVDTASVFGAYSDYAAIKYSAAPALASVTPANAATITDPTTPFHADYSSSGGKALASYQLVASVGESVIYDSGLVAAATGATAIDIEMPAFRQDDAQTVSWTLTAYDTDGLYASVTRSYTTDFTQPAALTGLALTVNDDEKAIDFEWDESLLSDAEFYAYDLWAKPADGDFYLFASISDKTQTAARYLAAVHNAETIIRVTQSNGWMSSEPIEDSATVEADGYWLKRPGQVTPLPTAETDYAGLAHHGPGDTPTDIERIEPLDRGEVLLLTWQTTGYEGVISLRTQDRALIRQLRSWKEGGDVSILATPYGESRYIRLLTTPDDDDPVWWINAQLSYVEVLPSSADF